MNSLGTQPSQKERYVVLVGIPFRVSLLLNLTAISSAPIPAAVLWCVSTSNFDMLGILVARGIQLVMLPTFLLTGLFAGILLYQIGTFFFHDQINPEVMDRFIPRFFYGIFAQQTQIWLYVLVWVVRKALD